MNKYCLLLLFTLVGCQQAAPISQPIPVQPPEVTHGVSIELPTSTVAALHRYLGDANTVTLSAALTMQQSNVTIALAAGSNFSYVLNDNGGTITFNDPKPVLTITELGIPIHPVLERIVLTSPDKAVAYAKYLGRDWSRVISVSDETPGVIEQIAPPLKTEPIKMPVVYMWSGPNCPPCNAAKTAFAEAKASGDLPFDVIYDPKGVVMISAPPDGLRPHFEWQFGNNTEWITGWPGLPKFVEHWKKTRNKVVPPGPTKVASRR